VSGRAAALAEGICAAEEPAYHGDTVGGRFRKWSLRDVLELAERREPGALARLSVRLPDRLRPMLDIGELRGGGPEETLALDDAEEVLLSLDSMAGDGSGRLLEGTGIDLATRTLDQGGLGVNRDLLGTMARMRVPLERPFVGVDVVYELAPTPTGFSLTVGVVGQPRSTRLLRALTAGAIRAASRYCREADPDALRLFAETLGDRTQFEARYKAPDPATMTATAPAPKVAHSRRPRTPRPPATPLTDEVERIMTRAGLPSVPPGRPPAAGAFSSRPARATTPRPEPHPKAGTDAPDRATTRPARSGGSSKPGSA
jgi:hypothetical protein